MAKKAILDVLEHTIGRYVLNLDAQSLNVAVWSGKIELNSLELDTYSINNELERQAHESPNLALPIRVLGGRFESLQVDVPWTKLTSKSVLFRAKGLYITVEPYNNSHATQQSFSTSVNKKKNPRAHAIDIADQARLRTNALRELAEDDGSGDQSSFTSRLVRRIIENLQVDIEDIHVSLKGCGASAGIVLGGLSLVTTDEKGDRSFVDRASQKGSFLHKALNITNFGVYLDEIQELSTRKTLMKSKANSSRSGIDHSYILSPLSFQASLRQSDSVRCIDFPKYRVSSILSNMSILLSRTQLELANKISQVIQPVKGLRPLFPEYRPNTAIMNGGVKLWWKYAVRCIGRLTRRRSWTEFFLAYKKRKRYIPLYKQAMHSKESSWIKSITKSDQSLLNKMDMDTSISVPGIMSWRNISDAQVKRERRKYEDAKAKLAPENPTGYRAFFRYQEIESTAANDLDTVPISLTVEEMKELQDIDLKHIATAVLSSDSKLYDFNFSLGSFKVDLIKKTLQPIARFEMGQMQTNFCANNDGSYNFGFTLSSMQVDDMVTRDTLFSSIVHSLQSPSSASFKHAFEFRSKKAKEGDQDIKLKLVAFEIVASPEVLNEVKTFFNLQKKKYIPKEKLNPVLKQSVTGGADIYYDAVDDSEFRSPSLVNATAAVAAKATTKMSDKLSNALSAAWNQKKVRKRTWTMDCNIHAPIFVIPENVKDPQGTVLILDMGNLHIVLGNNPSSKEVEEWFVNRMEKHKFYNEVDHWKLEMKNLSFLVGKAGNMDWKSSSSSNTVGNTYDGKYTASQAIVEPLSITLSAGTENSIADFPLVCIHGVLPHISVKMSPNQLSRILSVVSTWKSFANNFSSSDNLSFQQHSASSYTGGAVILEKSNVEDSMNISQTASQIDKTKTAPASNLNLSSSVSGAHKDEIKSDWLHISLALHRLSAKFETNNAGSLEAHLVSVVISQTNFIDNSSSLRLCMGWFWILDLLTSSFPRQQRLLAHSSLPKPASTYAHNENYQVMEDFELHGVFEKSFSGSTDLADISILKTPYQNSGGNANNANELSTFINATFSSLYINWNPQSIKSLLLLQSQVSSLVTVSSNESSLTPSRHKKYTEEKIESTVSIATINSNQDEITSAPTTIKATMKKLQLSLNSAKDDLPLFVLTMANSKLNTLSSQTESRNLEATFSVGNIRIQTPTGRTYENYNTIIGLAPNQTSSLLTVKYYKGKKAIESSRLSEADKKCYEAFAEVELSPMRIVYIQAQIMALVEFVTNGVLGAMAAQVASSAKAAALEAAKDTQGLQLYQIKASGIDFVLPQAANLEKYFILHAGAFLVWYRTLEDGGAEAKISLNDVLLESNTNFHIVSNPIRMSIDAKLPSILAPTIEDRAMRINVNFSKASFLLSHEQYAQMMNTLSMNVGAADSFLRAEIDIYGDDRAEDSPHEVIKNDRGNNLTHAGVSAVFIEKRMYLSFNFEEMCLGLAGRDEFDPILSLSAVQTSVSFKFLPDEERMVTEMTLHNLEVEDRRRISFHRHFRSLVSQVEGQSTDVFKLSYIRSYDGSRSVDVVLGSPQVVILPDVIQEVLNFSYIESREVIHEKVRGSDSDAESGTEVGMTENRKKESYEQGDFKDESTFRKQLTTTYSLKTSNCQFVLVDMGNETLSDRKKRPKSTLEEVKELTEAIVFQGKVDTKMTFTTSSINDPTDSTKIQFQAEQMQLYTGEGRNLDSPVQILEPVNVAVHLTKMIRQEGNEEIELKAVSLSPIDMIFSMQNAALLNAILSSISDSLLVSSRDDKKKVPIQLSQEETMKLERLSLAMGEENDWENDGISITSEANSDAHSGKTGFSSNSILTLSKDAQRIIRINATVPEIVITMINDLQGLDQALFKIIARNVVSGAEFKVPLHSTSASYELTYNAHLNASLLADFFDISTNLWANFLREPWEVTISSKRAQGNKFKSNRYTTLLDIESHPCFISFSEQFLVGIGAAKQMWSMYSAAMSNASSMKQIENGSMDTGINITETKNRKILAANAARALVTTMPYGINNQTGLTVEFSMDNGEKTTISERHKCSTGDIKFFRFESPRVQGIGGKRVYGQDVQHFRSLSIFIGSSTLHFSHIDAEVNRPRHAHRLEGGQFIFTEFVNTGKATVSISHKITRIFCRLMKF